MNIAEIIKVQRRECTEHLIYERLAAASSSKNKEILKRIAHDEKRHEGILQKITGKKVKPLFWHVHWYNFLARFAGLSFAFRMMERQEPLASAWYKDHLKDIPKGMEIVQDEHRHEKELLGMLNEEKLTYASSIVLGLNDALVELTGALTGFTLALSNAKIVAATGLITGFAAALSMGGSSYFSAKEEGTKQPLRSSLYTGITYIITVLLLIAPFIVCSSAIVALGWTIGIALFIIFLYTYYMSVAKAQPFWPRFATMALLSLVIALLSFAAGLIVKSFIGVEA